MSAAFGATSVAYPEGSFYAPGEAVGDSRDLHRVLELPRRPATARDAGVYARLSKGPVTCSCRERFLRRCAKDLLPVQAWALTEAAERQGLLGPIGVGHGKTLLDLLTPMVMPNCRVAVLLVQPNLRDQLLSIDWHFYGQHWHLPNLAGSAARSGFAYPDRPWLHVVAFSELSGARSSDLLDRIGPDLIIADEAHNLRRREAARTKRFLRYFAAHPETRLCAWSGTLTSKSLKDFAHLSNLALRDGSPTPMHWPTVEEWATAVDPVDFPAPLGKLAAFCSPGEHVRAGYRRRILETPGVVSSGDTDSCEASLVISERKVTAPPEVHRLITQIATSWTRPDGEELTDAFSKARCMREMACGFFYRWRWPRMEPVEVINAWLDARKEWHRELRERLKRGGVHMDSPLLLTKAAIRWYEGYAHVDPRGGHSHGRACYETYLCAGCADPNCRDSHQRLVCTQPEGARREYPPETRNGPQPTWESLAWPDWKRLRDTAKPEPEAVWVDDFLAQNAAEWVKSTKGICWYDHDAFGRKVRDLSGHPMYGPGDEASQGIIREKGDRGIIASLHAHRAGKNLQGAFSKNLLANPITDGGWLEQLIGRTHRQGQLADEVTLEVYRHTAEVRASLDRARELAAFIGGDAGVLHGSQKLSRATYLW